MNMKKTALAVALAGVLGVGIGTAQASLTPLTYTGSNFSMLSSANAAGTMGGANDVSGSWDGTVYTSCGAGGAVCNFTTASDITAADAASNMSLNSTTKFFAAHWTAHAVEVFGPGTYTFTEAGGATQAMTVGTGQVGAHMLFNWSTTDNIGVADVFNINANYTAPFYSGGTTSDPLVGTNNHLWGLASTGGQPMVNGPFPGKLANFNVAPVPIPAAAWLFGSGLIGLVGVARRRRQNRQS